MIRGKVSKEFNIEVKADTNHAQILIEVNSSENYEEARKIIEFLGIHITETKHLSSNWVLYKLDVKDMRDVALKLTEHGFFIKGINALP